MTTIENRHPVIFLRWKVTWVHFLRPEGSFFVCRKHVITSKIRNNQAEKIDPCKKNDSLHIPLNLRNKIIKDTHLGLHLWKSIEKQVYAIERYYDNFINTDFINIHQAVS